MAKAWSVLGGSRSQNNNNKNKKKEKEALDFDEPKFEDTAFIQKRGYLHRKFRWVSAKRLNHPFLGAGYRDDTDGSERLKSFTPHVLTMDVPEVELNV